MGIRVLMVEDDELIATSVVAACVRKGTSPSGSPTARSPGRCSSMATGIA